MLGTILLLAVGLMLSGAVLNMARHGMFLSEGVGTALYLLSGAVFPLSVLPNWLQSISLCLPHTYGMEGLRRSLMVSAVPSGPLSSWPQSDLALVVLLSTALFFLLGQAILSVRGTTGSSAGSLRSDFRPLGGVTLFARRYVESLEALKSIVKWIAAGAPAFVGASRQSAANQPLPVLFAVTPNFTRTSAR